jgi:hypothetical protein
MAAPNGVCYDPEAMQILNSALVPQVTAQCATHLPTRHVPSDANP